MAEVSLGRVQSGKNVASVRFYALAAVRMTILVLLFWVVTPCGLVGTTVSEKHAVLFLRAENGQAATQPRGTSSKGSLSPEDSTEDILRVWC
jgi:hypothetical protein